MKSLQFILGDLTKRSAYDQYATFLNIKPSSIHAFGPRAEAVRGEVLLTLKGIGSPAGLKTGAFSFDLPDKRGFQIGNPWQARSAQLEVFIKGDANWVEIICGTKNESVKLTQPEINRILASFHTEEKDSSTSAKSSSNPTASASHLLAVH
jgi:hypothetical protein